MTPAAQKRMAQLRGEFRRRTTAPPGGSTRRARAPTTTWSPQPRRALPPRLQLGGRPADAARLYNNLKRIVQTDDHVMILVEMVHDARIVRMNPQHLPRRRSEVAGRLDRPLGRRHAGGRHHQLQRPARAAPADRDLHVVERFTRARLRHGCSTTSRSRIPRSGPRRGAASTCGRRASDRVFEYACHEGNYALGNIMRGARLLEKEAIAAKNGCD